MKRYDLAIIGGGVAGGFAALLAAKAGRRVVVIEKATFPRDKVCGEVISRFGVDCLRRAGLYGRLRDAGAQRLTRTQLFNRNGSGFDGTIDALSFSRGRLDALLQAESTAAGADWITDNVRDLDHDALLLRDGDAAIRFEQLFAADGRRSTIAQRLGLPPIDPRTTDTSSRFGLKAHFDGVTDVDQQTVELHLLDGGYLGLCAIEAGRWNGCFQIEAQRLRDGVDPQKVFERALHHSPALQQRFKQATRCTRWHAIGPLQYGSRTPAADGVWFLGDAAGTVDPFCGLGIGRALRSAELAVDALVHDRDYAQAWRRELGGQAMRNRILGSGFEHPQLADWLIGSVGRRFPSLARRAVRLSWS